MDITSLIGIALNFGIQRMFEKGQGNRENRAFSNWLLTKEIGFQPSFTDLGDHQMHG